MKIERNKIAEATSSELFGYYLSRDWDTIMPFSEFMRRCQENGTKIISERSSLKKNERRKS